ncbi:hypothetical protein [Natronococcus roseus]|uniref:hypothetical protein n=1 Tax=Natronococcus roseus TaxID=1052014 RepID=UPI00374D280C
MSLIDPSEDLNRIREAREGDDDSSSPTIYRCPIDECGRVVVNDRVGLFSHVAQSSDDAHSGLELNDDLEVVERDESDSSSDSSEKDDGDTIDSPESPESPERAVWGPSSEGASSEPLMNSAADCNW